MEARSFLILEFQGLEPTLQTWRKRDKLLEEAASTPYNPHRFLTRVERLSSTTFYPSCASHPSGDGNAHRMRTTDKTLFVGRRINMWTCTNCNEQLEDNFDSCWKCGTAQDGSPPPVNFVEKKQNKSQRVDPDGKKPATYIKAASFLIGVSLLLFGSLYTSESIGYTILVAIICILLVSVSLLLAIASLVSNERSKLLAISVLLLDLMLLTYLLQ